ncbi:hypothetical protein QNM99_03645 [Pseudomonas sp. PCH446]
MDREDEPAITGGRRRLPGFAIRGAAGKPCRLQFFWGVILEVALSNLKALSVNQAYGISSSSVDGQAG